MTIVAAVRRPDTTARDETTTCIGGCVICEGAIMEYVQEDGELDQGSTASIMRIGVCICRDTGDINRVYRKTLYT